jgi:hypothetical protein
MIGSRPASKTAEMPNVVEQKRIAGISAQTSSDVARIFLFASRKHEKNEKTPVKVFYGNKSSPP